MSLTPRQRRALAAVLLAHHDQLRVAALSALGGIALALVVVGIPLLLGRIR